MSTEIIPIVSITNLKPLFGYFFAFSDGVTVTYQVSVSSFLNRPNIGTYFNTLLSQGKITPLQQAQLLGNLHNGLPAFFMVIDPSITPPPYSGLDLQVLSDDLGLGLTFPGFPSVADSVNVLNTAGYCVKSEL